MRHNPPQGQQDVYRVDRIFYQPVQIALLPIYRHVARLKATDIEDGADHLDEFSSAAQGIMYIHHLTFISMFIEVHL